MTQQPPRTFCTQQQVWKKFTDTQQQDWKNFMEIKLKNKLTGEILWVYNWYSDYAGWDTPTDFYSSEDYEEVPEQ